MGPDPLPQPRAAARPRGGAGDAPGRGRDHATGDRPDDATLLTHLLGPTGNLRAPTLKVGKTLLVGFHEATYRDVLGLG